MLDYNGCLPLVESVVNTKVNEKIEDETIQSNKNKNRVRYKQTSLKIFKHYKLQPSFSIIKDEKAKDKLGVGDKPPPPSFNKLIKFDPILSSLIRFNPI